MPTLDDLNARVTRMILDAERDPTPDKWAAVCAVELALALEEHSGSIGRVAAQRGAVDAARKAGLDGLSADLRELFPDPLGDVF